MSWLDSITGRKTATTTASPSGASVEPHDVFVPAPFDPSTAADVSSFLSTPAFDPSSLHPLAGLDEGLEYLKLEDEALSDLPGSNSFLPSRGWSDDLCYGTGTTYLAALSIGGAWGFIEGVNRSPPMAPPKLKLNSILNGMTRRGPFMGNSAGVIAMVYNGINSTIGHVRGRHDTANSVVAGALSGAIFKSTRGVRPMLIASGITGTVAGVWAVSRKAFL
ncbi:Mitochondrial import inner membrane translocase subunit tim23 [Orbilia javanica]|uniref:Mitochondrial import inner membrane translocase subunit TIM23 n=1 Tax=Orbilia javanica TaxID=47235 RepID=A0AAN8RC83_9PEZI